MRIIRCVKFSLISIVLFYSLSFVGCNRDDDDQYLEANLALYSFMDYWYLWYEHMPAVNVEDYPSPIELLEALRYKELDRWSYVTTRQNLEAYYEEGKYVGYGFGSAFDANNNLWITFVFRNSPFTEFGVERGWRITKINSITPTPENVNSLLGPDDVGFKTTFTFAGSNDEVIVRVVEKSVIAMNTVLMDTIYNFNGSKVGYFVLKGFITPTTIELDEVFSDFQLQGVSDLIVDLRYNTGGSLDVSNHLAGQIAGSVANGEIYATLVHNDKRQDKNYSSYITAKPNSLSLNRVVFVTTGLSASASEALINGLKPHMGVTLVGSTTYGKPVGMYGKTYENFDWAFVPICFRVLNANGEGDFYDGIPVDYTCADGVEFPFGDLNEASIFTAINYLTGTIMKTEPVESSKVLDYQVYNGIQSEIGAW